MPQPTARPNVLFLFTDDQRFDTIAALGNPDIHTPNLDRLLARGVAFTRAHIMGGSHGAVCMPSRAMLHTGRTLYHIEGEGMSIPPEHVTMGECFRNAGYETFGTGKWHNGPESYARGFSTGAEIYFGGMADHWNVPAASFDPTGTYDCRIPKCRDEYASNDLRWYTADHVSAGVHSTDLLSGATCDFLRSRGDDRPFFAYCSFLAPHDPRTMPRKYLDLYDPESLTLPPNLAGGHPFDNGELYGRDEKLAPWPRTEPVIREHLRDYYAMISHLDDAIGRILETLDETGQRDNTIVVMAGDNGLAIGRHGLMGKQNVYDHSVRVPLIFAGPGVPAGQRREAFCYLLDIYPTLCGLTGLDTPASVDGRDLGPCLLDEDASVRDDVHLAFRGFQRAVRDERWKLIEYAVAGRRNTQLFDLLDDPWEIRNRAADPACAADLARMREKLQTWRTELDDNRERQGQDFWAAYDA